MGEHTPQPCATCGYDLTGLPSVHICPECGDPFGHKEHVAVPCPMCHYDLTGLPETHKCPACGLNYDEHTKVVRLAPKVLDGLGSGSEVGFAILILASMLVCGWPVIFLLLAGMFRIRHEEVEGPAVGEHCIIVNRGGVKFDLPGEITSIDWCDISRARKHWWSGELHVLDDMRRLRFKCKVDDGTTHFAVKAIQTRLDIYRPVRPESLSPIERLYRGTKKLIGRFIR